jgi:hypothetical protein
MKAILHIGSHHGGVTSLGAYLRANAAALTSKGVEFWGPEDLRHGLMAGLQPSALPALKRDRQKRGCGRVRLLLAEEQRRGATLLWVGDPNLLGTERDNLIWGTLYAGAGVRLARYAEAFDGQVTDVVLSIRDLASLWQAMLARAVLRGASVPGEAQLAAICTAPRSWRDVVLDVACAVPDARLWVAPYETFATQPDALFASVTGVTAPTAHARETPEPGIDLPRLRAAGVAGLPEGDGRWMPFDAEQHAQLRELYADDMMWLTGGAEGLARLMNDPKKEQADTNWPMTRLTEGSDDNDGQGRMAKTGGG